MVHYRRCHTILTILATVIIMAVSESFERQPVGPEMCKHYCGQLGCCTFCMFLERRLGCIAMMSKYPPQTKGDTAVYLNFTKERLGSISHTKTLCEERQSRIVRTRSNDVQCIKLRTEENTQLLVAPWRNQSRSPFRGFHLLDGSITTYHHIQPQAVQAMAYVPTLQQLLVATVTRRNIRAFSLYANVSVTIRRKVYVLSLVVDDAQQLVFLATMATYRCIFGMAPDGRHFKEITCQFRPSLLCLDRRREIMYAANSDYSRIYSFTYDGQVMNSITTSNNIHSLILSEGGDMMYYNDNTNIMKLELFKNGTGKKVCGSDFKVTCILNNKGHLYISSMENKYIRVYHDSHYSRLIGANPTGLTKQLIALLPESP